nr:50S ribosomal protein L11 methyltransferase [Pseudosporangium ferrugineum]
MSLRPVAFVPEVALFLAEDPTLLWARLEAAEGRRLGPPFWASAWSGGQALARYVLDHPELVAGRRVLDIASGSGLVAIAAARAGAASVLANDVDPYAAAAIVTNARANEVDVTAVPHDVLDGDGEGAEVILAGDALYEAALAVRVLAFLDRVAARGVLVLAGDPGRGHVPEGRLDRLAEYDELHLGPADDHRERRPAVFRARGRQP